MNIVTNNQKRFTIAAYELTEEERKEFDYLEWEAIDQGNESATFFRYKGQMYDLGEFMRIEGELKGWHGYSSDSYFSGILVKFPEDNTDSIIVARYYS